MKVKMLSAAVAGAVMLSTQAFAGSHGGTELVIATVNNGHMIEMQKLTPKFEEETGIKVRWVTLEEGVLRQRVTTDIATKGGQFDIMTIGMYEAPIWGEKGWLEPLNFSAEYNVDDILPAMRGGLSHEGNLYAAPFYGESSMVMYRKDLLDKAGITLPYNPTWADMEQAIAAMHDPENGVYGTCIRGKPGWGDNAAFITTIANTFGARWFDENWKPQLDSAEWNAAINFYVDLMTKYGPPGSTANSFNEILALMNEGKCGSWVDATIAASFVSDPAQSKVADSIAYAQAPVQKTKRGANWLWAWALGIPASSEKKDAAMKFLEWSTSADYINLVGETNGWGRVPTGTRASTYANEKFQAAANFASAEMDAINSANPYDSTFEKTPYTGVQFAAIPEFQAIGTAAGQQFAAALAGEKSVEEALAAAQAYADREMRKARYY
ncbi:Bacterial extracellular solute-binding protein [Marinobacterium sp. xm-g-59]|uniref:ABC transporter substrate-binding protein n=1 Tax=Marinobacterium sp. xm-g-59 TaxID=2497748 RepID=UPI00156875EF|nr:sugar ABC transporter substrate-binding protein [Marinobacterium sp. xm-g-59]NRP94880.1 Bacterial extracellular solute-binding protein [Marinobacterium sp. xm-g-59]